MNLKLRVSLQSSKPDIQRIMALESYSTLRRLLNLPQLGLDGYTPHSIIECHGFMNNTYSPFANGISLGTMNLESQFTKVTADKIKNNNLQY